MGKPVLLLRLEAPLQSWGIRSRWDVRDTQPEPTKSGIVGLLGCALGYRMYDPRLETELDAGLRFGVRVESPGSVLDDYQTITDFLPTADGRFKHDGVAVGASLDRIRSDPDSHPSTIISPRFYLEDAAFLVGLEETGLACGVLQRCASAIQQPAWPVFLGRKACVPTRPIFEALTDRYEDLEDALKRCPWSWRGASALEREQRPPDRLVAFIEDAGGPLRRQDAVRTNAARQYGFRQARRIEVHPPAHSAEASIEQGEAAQ